MSNVVVVDPDDVRVHLTGDRAVVQVTDPTISVTAEVGGGSSSPGVTDHGALTGLGDDDHPQYLKPAEVLAGTDVTVEQGSDGSVTIHATGAGSIGQAGWVWKATGGTTDPGVGNVWTDVNNASAASKVNISQTDADGVDRGAALTLLVTGDLLVIQDAGNASKFYRYAVTGPPVDQGAWWSIPVKNEGAGSGGEPVNDARVMVLILMTDTGPSDHGSLTGLDDDDHPQYAKAEHAHTTSQGVRYLYAGDTATGLDPGAGNVIIDPTGGQNRTFQISKTDADGIPRNPALALPGDGFVITDDPETPPVTGFARYVLVGDGVDHGTWVGFSAIRTDTAGSQTPPAIGTSLRVLLTFSSTTPGSEVNVFTGPTEPAAAREGDLWVVTDS